MFLTITLAFFFILAAWRKRRINHEEISWFFHGDSRLVKIEGIVGEYIQGLIKPLYTLVFKRSYSTTTIWCPIHGSTSLYLLLSSRFIFLQLGFYLQAISNPRDIHPYTNNST